MTQQTEFDASWRPATRLVRGALQRSQFQETCEGLFMTSGYVYDRAEDAEAAFKGEKKRYVYSRYANPTVAMFEKRLALLEGAKFCMATASGMAAVFMAIASQLKAGDRVVASRALFGSCQYIIAELLPAWGFETVLIDGTDMSAWKKALSKKTKCVFLETPSNPTLEIIDIAGVARLAHKAGARLIVDNVFATPILQKSLTLGADVVMYSATKHIDGQGRTLGGAVLTNDEAYYTDCLTPFMRHTGPTLSAFNAWILLKGLETLDLRVRQHCKNARAIAAALSKNKKVGRVIYPALPSHPQHNLAMAQMEDGGTIISFEVPGGKPGAFRFLNALKIVDISNNLGDTKSLITHPATTTHQRLKPEDRAAMGISDGLVRISVGLEDPDDIRQDLEQAIKKAAR